MKNQKGITLIALVITIIVLLILAGVSIAMLTGENGILTQASDAKTQTTKAEVAERINMELNAMKADLLAYGSVKNETLTAAQANLPTAEDYTVTVSTDTITITNTNGAKGIIYINAVEAGTDEEGNPTAAHAKGEIIKAEK